MKRTSKVSTGGESPKEPTGPKPMDANVRERAVGVPHVNASRACWAIKTLTEEFIELFPEAVMEYTTPNGRNTLLGVIYYLGEMPSEDRDRASALLGLTSEDNRVSEVIAETDSVYIEIHNNPRIMDLRDPFGLGDAYLIMAEGGSA